MPKKSFKIRNIMAPPQESKSEENDAAEAEGAEGGGGGGGGGGDEKKDAEEEEQQQQEKDDPGEGEGVAQDGEPVSTQRIHGKNVARRGNVPRL